MMKSWKIPVIIYGQDFEKEVLAEYLESGARDFIKTPLKPADYLYLREYVQNYTFNEEPKIKQEVAEEVKIENEVPAVDQVP